MRRTLLNYSGWAQVKMKLFSYKQAQGFATFCRIRFREGAHLSSYELFRQRMVSSPFPCAVFFCSCRLRQHEFPRFTHPVRLSLFCWNTNFQTLPSQKPLDQKILNRKFRTPDLHQWVRLKTLGFFDSGSILQNDTEIGYGI